MPSFSGQPRLPSKRPPSRPLFWIFLAAIPVLFFVALEAGLRVIGFGEEVPLFLTYPENAGYRYQNPQVAARFFRAEESLPSSNVDFFRTKKAPNGFRIFVLGGSSAAGYPFYRGGSFPRMLEQRLQQAYPGREIEVVNTAMAAVNSYALLNFVDEILAEAPDAVLVYAGHNEYYGALGVGSTEAISPFPGLVRLTLRLRRFRIVQGIEALVTGAARLLGPGQNGNRRQTTLMERMVREQHIPSGSPLYERGIQQFSGNLDRILGRFRTAGVPVFVGTLASNELDHPPFFSEPDPETDRSERDARYGRAVAALAAGDTTAALADLTTCVETDARDAQASYLKGRILFAQGRYDEARAALLQAKDNDQLRFRAPEAFNEVIRTACRRPECVLVETQEALRAASPGHIIGSAMMLEHLHPTIEGYLRLAGAYDQAIRGAGLLEPGAASATLLPVPFRHLCTAADSLAGLYRIERLEAGWPFVPIGQEVDPIATRPKGDPISELAREMYYDRVNWEAAMSRQWQHFLSVGRTDEALRAALAVIQEYPFHGSAYLLAANLLARITRFDEALPYYETANRLDPSAEAERMIGSILLNRGDRTASIPHLEAAVRLAPRNVQGLYNLGGAYALLGRYADARRTLSDLLDLQPDHTQARRLLASLPATP